jgi:predicted nucleic acid-binding protein
MNLIDTPVIVEDLRGAMFHEGAISVIELFEIIRGLDEDKRERAKSLLEEAFDIIALNGSVMDSYCRLYSQLVKSGRPFLEVDLLIAATAISHDLKLVTKNEEFQDLEEFGLRVDLLSD